MKFRSKSTIDHRRRVLIHCQYVYGIGHFVRTLELAAALQETFDVTVLNGGEAISNFSVPTGFECVQLPAIYKEEFAHTLSSVDQTKSLEQCFAERQIIIERVVRELAPDILITEHYPFGLLFSSEVQWLINLVRANNSISKIVCSVRDVIETTNGGLNDVQTCDLLNRDFDLVLIHGDENIIPLSASFSEASTISIPIRHTGYMVRSLPERRTPTTPPILVVSIGGGRLGGELQESLLNAHSMLFRSWPHQLIIFKGAFQSDGWITDLNSSITVLPFNREAYDHVLARATLLICMGGYNSLLEGVVAGLPVIVYNRDFKNNNQEQECRITWFANAGLINVLSPADLVEPERLCTRILMALDHNPASLPLIRLNGAEMSRLYIMELISAAY